MKRHLGRMVGACLASCPLLVLMFLVNLSHCGAQSISSAAATQAAPEFEAATIKLVKDPDPNQMNDREDGRRFRTKNTTLADLMMMAYRVDRRQIVGGPAWATTEEYDVDAVAEDEAQMEEHGSEMFQKLLQDRFHLLFHREQREMPVYVLAVSKGGSKMKLSGENSQTNSSCQRLGQCTFGKESMQHFARWMQFVVLDKPVVDKTSLTGVYDFSLRWTPDESQFYAMGIHVQPPATNDPNALPSLFAALQDQLGLKLEAQKTTAEVIVIDQVERPLAN